MKPSKHRAAALILALGFLLGSRSGYLALWKDGQEAPLAVYPFPVRCFPKNDQKSLKQGIRAETVQEIARLLEDFLS